MIGRRATWRGLVGALLFVAALPAVAGAQYFGRNKVQYRTFDFQVLKTEHFDLYYYPEEAEAAKLVARMAERWHDRLARFFGHELRGRQPLILYAASAHFRQTNAVEDLIGEGTGGVTEAFKRRVVLPMSGSLADTDHVLGHELVHAFQFDLTGTDPREGVAQMPGILAFPLWFAEGMAEYLSIGTVDPQTTMWLRDAALREKLPHIKDLDDWRYFPYRWGHAFWAFIGAKYGDRSVASLIRSAANPRFDLIGLARQLGTDPDTLTEEWHQAIRLSTAALAEDAPPLTSEAKRIIGPDAGGGRYNVGPRVSPDGRHIAFFSERDRFSVELFLADAHTGRIERKLLKSASDPHFDSLEFLNSAGAWSPDGKSLALTAVRDGHPVIAFIDPQSGRIQREIELKGLDDAVNPTFAPDGKSMAFSGNKGGLFDLYLLNVQTGAFDQLMADATADLEPAFTADGRSLVFVTERFTTNLDTLEPGPLRLARIDLADRTVRAIPAFLRGKQISPMPSADGHSVTFVADPDGVSNLYRIAIDGGPVERLSSVATGIAGITSTSPTLSESTSGRLVFSVFEDGGHVIYAMEPADIVAQVPPDAGMRAAVLPGRSVPGGDVQRMVGDFARGLPPSTDSADTAPYDGKLKLDVLGQPSITAGVTSYGAYVGGGISAWFSDMLGDRGLGLAVEVSGSFADFGGQLFYMNRRHRWNWALSLENSPYRVGYLTLGEDVDAGQILLTETIERQTNRGVFGTTTFPFSHATRFEVSGGARQLTFTRDLRTRVYSSETGEQIDRRNTRITTADPLYLAQTNAAIVHDSTFNGAISPIFGMRYRLEAGHSAGSLDYSTALVDFRRYFMPARPVTVGIRAMHVGRYGRDSDHPQLVDFYAGYPEFVRGYGFGSFSSIECLDGAVSGECSVFNSLIGSRMLVGNLEVRAPLVGLFRGTLDYGRLPVEVAGFVDAALTWDGTTQPSFAGGARRPVRSAGFAVRANAFGLILVELSVARPIDRVDKSLQWQIGIRQGF